MPSNFDPYQSWLRIPTGARPPNHYDLLGIKLFESDPEQIDKAVHQRVELLQDLAIGEHAEHSQKLLNEIATARLCLTNPVEKKNYDAKIRAAAQPKPVAASKSDGPLNKTAPVSQKTVTRKPVGKPKAKNLRPTKPAKATQLVQILLGGMAALALALILFFVLRGSGDSPLADVQLPAEEVKSPGKVTGQSSQQKNAEPTKRAPAKKPATPRKKPGREPDKNREPTVPEKLADKNQPSPTSSDESTTGSTGTDTQPIENHLNQKIVAEQSNPIGSADSSKNGDESGKTPETNVASSESASETETPKPAVPNSTRVARAIIPREDLVFRLDASDERLQDGPVKEWPNHPELDQSILAVVPDSENRPLPSGKMPVRVSDAINGRPAIEFSGQSGVGPFFELGNLSTKFPNEATIFVVAAIKDSNYNLYSTNPLSFPLITSRSMHASSFVQDDVSMSADPVKDGLHTFTIQSGKGNHSIWIDGQLVGQKSVEYSPGEVHRIGSPSSFNVDDPNWEKHWKHQFFKGQIGEVVAYSRRLGDAQRKEVENYLYHKWNSGSEGPLPLPERVEWVDLPMISASIVAKDETTEPILTGIDETSPFGMRPPISNDDQTILVRAKLTVEELSALSLVVYGMKDDEPEIGRFSVYDFSAWIVDPGASIEGQQPLSFSTEDVDSFVEGLENAIDTKPKPWAVPARTSQTLALFFLKEGKKFEKPDEKELVIRLRHKKVGQFRIQATARTDRVAMVESAHKLSGKDQTQYAPESFAVNFGPEAKEFDGFSWQPVSEFQNESSPFGYVGGKKRDFTGQVWRSCWENVEQFKAVLPNGRYNIRLVFGDPTDSKIGQRQFQISIGEIELPPFDIKTVVKQNLKQVLIPTNSKDRKFAARATAHAKEYLYVDLENVEVADKLLELRFKGVTGNPLIGGIAVVPARNARQP